MAAARSRVRRNPSRARYDPQTVASILDEALVSHVGVAVDGQPFVLPMLHARVGDVVYLHGSTASRVMRTLAAGAPACLTVTVLDGLVLARSVFHHSANYRSAVLLGAARPVEPVSEREAALAAFTERLIPGRSSEVRGPSPQELKATQIVAFPLAEATAKIRTGPPVDDAEDVTRDVWAGVIPLGLAPGRPQPDAVAAGRPVSPSVEAWLTDRGRPSSD